MQANVKPIEPPSMKAKTEASTIMKNLHFVWENVDRWVDWGNLRQANVLDERLIQQRTILL